MPLLILLLLLSFIQAYVSKCICQLEDRPDYGRKIDTARWMVHSLDWGVLTTLSTRFDTPAPFGNVYSFVDGSCHDSTGIPYFFGTFMDQSFQDAQVNPAASFTLSEAAIPSTCTADGMGSSSCTIANLPSGAGHQDDELVHFPTKFVY